MLPVTIISSLLIPHLTSLGIALQINQPQWPLYNPISDGSHQQPPHGQAPVSDNAVQEQEQEALFALHRDLVNIDSTPDNEHDIGVYLEAHLRALNFTVERQNIPLNDPDSDVKHRQRFNVFAYPPSHRSAPILLTSHIDTVPIFYPYHLTPSTGQISGRGSVDAKACVATQIHAALRLRSSSRNPSLASQVALLFVVGEEVSGDGMKAANNLGVPWKHVIFGEPTEFKLASGHKGLIIFRVTAHGKATHSGYPWLGHSANEGLLHALNALESVPWPSSAKYGNSTLNIGLMKGGSAANVMPELAVADVAIRIAAGNDTEVSTLVQNALDSVSGEKLDLKFGGGGYGPIDIDADIDGFETVTVNYGTDIPHLKGDHKRYLYGPGSILVAHSDHEHLYQKDLVRAVDDYERLVRAVAGR